MKKEYIIAMVILFAVIGIRIGISGSAKSIDQEVINMANMTNATNNATDIPGKTEVAVFETTLGTIEVEIDRGKAPITAENFAQYVKSGFYDGLVFHRVISTFMIQGGGFTHDGVQKETSAPIKLESDNGLLNSVGTVAMARTNDPNSATSQFFINVADNGFLNYAPGNPGYAVFGKVVSGMDAVNKIKSLRTSSRGPYSDWPVEDVVITRAYMK